MATVYTQDSDDLESEASNERQHDLLASLAIARGFCAALDASFNELLNGLQTIDNAGHLPAPGSHDSKRAESDCRFCLSRLLNTLERLEAQIAEIPLASGQGSRNSTDNTV